MATDIVFIIDNTGSMGDYISQVQANVVSFANDLNASGQDYRLGLVEYGDNNDSSIKTYDFTTNIDTFVNDVNSISLTGGGDGAESGLEALETALSMVSDSANSKRFIVVTDADYHNQGESGDGDSTTYLNTATVVDHLKTANVVVDVVGTPYYAQPEWDEPIAQATGGEFYDINGSFPTILTNIVHNITGASTMHMSRWSYSFGSSASSTTLTTSEDLINGGVNYYYGRGSQITYNADENNTVNVFGVSLEQVTSANISAGAVNLTFNDGGSLTMLGQSNSQFVLNGSTWTADQSTQTWSKA